MPFMSCCISLVPCDYFSQNTVGIWCEYLRDAISIPLIIFPFLLVYRYSNFKCSDSSPSKPNAIAFVNYNYTITCAPVDPF